MKGYRIRNYLKEDINHLSIMKVRLGNIAYHLDDGTSMKRAFAKGMIGRSLFRSRAINEFPVSRLLDIGTHVVIRRGEDTEKPFMPNINLLSFKDLLEKVAGWVY